MFFGPEYTAEELEGALKASGFNYQHYENIEDETAQLIPVAQ